jgi:hypothetical protein
LLGFSTTISALSWALFWTTRWQSKIFATLLSYLCMIGTWGFVLLLLNIPCIILSCFGFLISEPEWIFSAANIVTMIISLPIGISGLRRAAGYYQSPEAENRYHFSSVRLKSDATKQRLLTRLFPKKAWSPFTALLWQSIGQSFDILLLGFVTVLTFCGWWSFVFFLGDFIEWNDVSPSYFNKVVVLFSYLITFGCSFMLIGFASTIFSQDQEGRQFRALTERGISYRLIWWSRIIPYAFVYLIPLIFFGGLAVCGFTLHFFYNGQSEFSDTNEFLSFQRIMIIITVLYLLPFSFGSFFSMFCRSILKSIILTFGFWLVVFIMSCDVFAYPVRKNTENQIMLIIFGIICVLSFLLASQWMTKDWLKEKSRWFGLLKLVTFFIFSYTLAAVSYLFVMS